MTNNKTAFQALAFLKIGIAWSSFLGIPHYPLPATFFFNELPAGSLSATRAFGSLVLFNLHPVLLHISL